MTRKQSVFNETSAYRWEEHSGRRYIIAGPREHYWILRHYINQSFTSEKVRLEDAAYRTLFARQKTHACKLTESVSYAVKTDEKIVEHLYWFQDRFFLVAPEFNEIEVPRLVADADASAESEKRMKQRKRQDEIDSLKQKIREP